MSSSDATDGEQVETTRQRRLVAPSRVREFITSGRAIFTVKNTETRNRGTFRVEYEDDGTIEIFAFTGSDNSVKSDYTQIGTIQGQMLNWYTPETECDRLRAAIESDDYNPWLLEFLDSWQRYHANGWEPSDKMIYRYRAACRKYQVPPALTSNEKTTRMKRMFAWVWNKAHSDGLFPENIEVWHEGICCRCGKRLTVPASIELGMGADCAKEKGYFELWEKLNNQEAA